MNASTKPVYGNCIQQTAWALLSGHGDYLLVIRSRSIVWPVHLCLVYGKRYIAFESTHKEEFFAPWWFEGRWCRVDPEKVQKRRLFPIRNRMLAFLFVCCLIAIVQPLWLPAWALYQPCYMGWWFCSALRKVN